MSSATNFLQRKAMLEMLATFRNLRNLTLRVRSLVQNHRLNVLTIDTDRAAVEEHYCDLLSSKQGASLEKTVFVVDGYSTFLGRHDGRDGSPSVSQGARIFFCEDDVNGPVVREERQPRRDMSNHERLWELDAA